MVSKAGTRRHCLLLRRLWTKCLPHHSRNLADIGWCIRILASGLDNDVAPASAPPESLGPVSFGDQ